MRRLRLLLIKIGPYLILAAFTFVLGKLIFARHKWACTPALDVRVLLVDYSVPFDNYKEHSGLTWLLNHLRVSAPGSKEAWSAETDYVGYYPADRAHPRRISEVRPLEADLIYLADTYGVYRDDLRDIKHKRSHMDYNPLVFGGLSSEDARSLADFAERGGSLIAEFNSFCDPTTPEPRQLMERLLGVRWTGWVGRIFADPYDVNDVPRWLEREVRAQYGVRLPHLPMLVFVHRQGRLVYFTARTLDGLAPQVELTEAGRRRYERARGDVPFFYWFSVAEPSGAETEAELVLPDWLEGVTEFQETGIGARVPLVTERREGKSLRVYIAADLADLDFDPGQYSNLQSIEAQAGAVFSSRAVSSAPAFWRLYLPAMRTWLEELAETNNR